jgi:hypothetical protein
MVLRKVSRWQASGIHLLISVGIALTVLTLMLTVWYPWPLFEAMGGSGLLLILCGVDVVLGPLITLIVFRQGKRGMKFDLVVIAIVQSSALLYGSHIVYLARPAFIVFVKDQFEVSIAAEMEPGRLAKAKVPEYRNLPHGGPRLVFADFPTDPEEHNKLVMAAMAGLDMQQFPQYFVPYESRTAEILAKAQPIERIRRNEPETGEIIDAWLAKTGTKESDVRYFPLRARQAWVAVLVDAQTAKIVKMLIAERIM